MHALMEGNSAEKKDQVGSKQQMPPLMTQKRPRISSSSSEIVEEEDRSSSNGGRSSGKQKQSLTIKKGLQRKQQLQSHLQAPILLDTRYCGSEHVNTDLLEEQQPSLNTFGRRETVGTNDTGDHSDERAQDTSLLVTPFQSRSSPSPGDEHAEKVVHRLNNQSFLSNREENFPLVKQDHALSNEGSDRISKQSKDQQQMLDNSLLTQSNQRLPETISEEGLESQEEEEDEVFMNDSISLLDLSLQQPQTSEQLFGMMTSSVKERLNNKLSINNSYNSNRRMQLPQKTTPRVLYFNPEQQHAVSESEGKQRKKQSKATIASRKTKDQSVLIDESIIKLPLPHHPYADRQSTWEEWVQTMQLGAISLAQFFFIDFLINGFFYYIWKGLEFILLSPIAFIGLFFEYLRKFALFIKRKCKREQEDGAAYELPQPQLKDLIVAMRLTGVLVHLQKLEAEDTSEQLSGDDSVSAMINMLSASQSSHSLRHRRSGKKFSAYKRRHIEAFLQSLAQLNLQQVFVYDTFEQLEREEAARIVKVLSREGNLELTLIDHKVSTKEQLLSALPSGESEKAILKRLVVIDKGSSQIVKALKLNAIAVQAGNHLSRPTTWKDLIEQLMLTKGNDVRVNLPAVIQMASYYGK